MVSATKCCSWAKEWPSSAFRSGSMLSLVSQSSTEKALGYFSSHPGKDFVPVPQLLLPEQSQGRIPWAVFTVLQPAPIGHRRHGDPDRHSEGAGQVSGRGIAGDDQVQVAHDGGRVGEILQTAAQVDEAGAGGEGGRVFRGGVFLQAIKLHSFEPGQRQELFERKGAVAVPAMFRVTLPDDADADLLTRRGQLLAPV